jgi:nitrite reductase/ring-hydroxylating ferredoxin subunit
MKKLVSVKDLFVRIFGGSHTKTPEDPKCWKYSKGKIVISWGRAQELHTPCGAVRLEKWVLPDRVLLVYGIDGQFHAFKNKCPHCGRCLEPVTDTPTICCCGLSRSTFDYTGNIMSGPGKDPLKTFKVETNKCKVIIHLS